MQQFSFYGRVCAMKGLLQALPKEVLCIRLQLLPAILPSPLPTAPSQAPPPAPHQAPPLAPFQADSSACAQASAATEPRQDVDSLLPAMSRTSLRTSQHSMDAEAPRTSRQEAQANGIDLFSISQSQSAPNAASTESDASSQPTPKFTPDGQDVSTHYDSAGTAGTAGSAGAVGTAWLLLSDGALPACCTAVRQSTDAHHKFHAVSALAFCLDRIKQCLQVSSTSCETHLASCRTCQNKMLQALSVKACSGMMSAIKWTCACHNTPAAK